MKLAGLGAVLATAVVTGSLAESGLNITVQMGQRHTLQKDCFGANCQIFGRPIWYDSPFFIACYEESGRPFFRFPGGTPANYYNPFKGTLDVIEASGRDYEQQNKKILTQTKGGGQTPDGFFRFAQQTQARYSVVLNMCTLTVEENERWLAEAKQNGAEIPAFELGNELYFGSYKWAFPRPEDYIECAKRTTAMLRRIYPEAKIGVLVPSQMYTTESFLGDGRLTRLERQMKWLALLEKENFFDAVVIHLYSTPGMDRETSPAKFLPYIDAYHCALAHMNANLDSTFDLLEKKFPGKSIWVTEYGLGGFSKNLRSYALRDSHLGGLLNDLMLLKFLGRPSITSAHWHSFSHFFNFSKGGRAAGTEPNQTFAHFKLFAEPVHNSTFYAPLCISGQAMQAGTAQHPAAYPDVEGCAVAGDKKGYLFLINKLDKTYPVETLHFQTGNEHVVIVPVNGVQLTLEKTVIRSDADTKQMFIHPLSREELGQLRLPPYSITRLEFQTEARSLSGENLP